MEDPKEKMIRRFVSMLTGYSERKILSKEGKLTEEEKMNIADALRTIKKSNFDINFIDIKVTYKELKRYSRKAHELAKANNKELVIIVDNLGLVDVPHLKDDISKENFVAQEMVGVREDTDALIFILHHMNKDLLGKTAVATGFKPTEQNVRGSSRIQDYANIVLLGNLPGKYDDLIISYESKIVKSVVGKLGYNDADFDKSFWSVNQNSDGNSLFKGITNLRGATMDELRTVMMNRQTFPDGTPLNMNTLFERYCIYFRKMNAKNDGRPDDKKSQVYSVWSWLTKCMYLEPIREPRTARDTYLFGDQDLTPNEQLALLKKVFIIDATKVRDSGQGSKRVIRYEADLNANTFVELDI